METISGDVLRERTRSTEQSTIQRNSLARTSPESSYVNGCGVRVHYIARGIGEQVLLLHGWGSSSKALWGVVDSLANHYSVFAIDFPGHGDSNLPPKPWSVSDYAECLLCVMDALGLSRPHIVAHSFGGRIAIKLAVMQPGRVNKMVLVDSAGVRPPRPPKYYVKVALAKIGWFFAAYGGHAGKSLRNYIYSRVGSKDYLNAGPLRETFVRIVNEDQTSMLPHIESPTLLVWGAGDRETPVASARRMQGLIPDASLVILQNAGHFSFVDQPNKFNLVVGKFLRP